MKVTTDIPQKELDDIVRFTQARTRQEAVVRAIVDFNQRRRMAELVKHAGTCRDLLTPDELREQRR